MKTALITGVCGQDGSYLAELLLSKGYRVVGVAKPRSDTVNVSRLLEVVDLRYGDITDAAYVSKLMDEIKPDEIYNLAAQSHVGHSFSLPQTTCLNNYTGYLNVLLSARRVVPKARIYQASTSEMFGYSATGERQSEDTPFRPMSPYAIAKVASHWAGVNARHEANQFVANGILFNHESPRRHVDFVTRKITNAVARIAGGSSEPLRLGNIYAKRDWGHAKDYVKAMWMMLQHNEPDDFVVASGQTRTVKNFIECAFNAAGMDIHFDGTGAAEKGYVGDRLVMEIDFQFYRPNDLNYLCGDPTKAANVLGWKPDYTFERLVNEMVYNDLDKHEMVEPGAGE